MRIVMAVAMAALAATAIAQTYPTKPIRFIVPYAPGGNTDILSRLIGQKLTEAWGQQVIIDNRPGAGGTVGAEITAKAPPDDYTIVMGSFGNVIVANSLYKRLSYGPLKDLAPVALVALPPGILVSRQERGRRGRPEPARFPELAGPSRRDLQGALRLLAVDTNILVYAHREEMAEHGRAVAVLRRLAGSRDPWAVPVFCLGEFVRVVTHPRLFDPPSSIADALGALDAVLEAPGLRILSPQGRYPALLLEAVREGDARGNLVFDAQIAAVCREHGVERLLTQDRDFRRFTGIDIVPLDGPVPGKAGRRQPGGGER